MSPAARRKGAVHHTAPSPHDQELSSLSGNQPDSDNSARISKRQNRTVVRSSIIAKTVTRFHMTSFRTNNDAWDALVEVIGAANVLQFVKSFGGIKLYVPSLATLRRKREKGTPHPIELAIGAKSAEAVSNALAGDRVEVPLLGTSIQSKQFARFVELYDRTPRPTFAEMTLILGVSQRTIRRYREVLTGPGKAIGNASAVAKTRRRQMFRCSRCPYALVSVDAGVTHGNSLNAKLNAPTGSDGHSED